MVSQRNMWIIGIIAVILIAILALAILRSPEDSWIKNSSGVYVQHGNPAEKPFYVNEQEQAIACATRIYNDAVKAGIVFSSQCLGSCGNYAVDIVHVPRTTEDSLKQNQCEEYLNGNDKNFIEMDKNGDIVRIG